MEVTSGKVGRQCREACPESLQVLPAIMAQGLGFRV